MMNSVYRKIWIAVRYKMMDQTNIQLNKSISDQVYDQIPIPFCSQIGNGIYNQVCKQIED